MGTQVLAVNNNLEITRQNKGKSENNADVSNANIKNAGSHELDV